MTYPTWLHHRATHVESAEGVYVDDTWTPDYVLRRTNRLWHAIERITGEVLGPYRTAAGACLAIEAACKEKK